MLHLEIDFSSFTFLLKLHFLVRYINLYFCTPLNSEKKFTSIWAILYGHKSKKIATELSHQKVNKVYSIVRKPLATNI